jgi:D-beta-D-heptose 7-phosphate kinase/D-beta-D-heptose 1-phosphate adenosyltransferase
MDTFAGLNVIVLGEAMLDNYLEGYTDRVCREAPVPVVTVANQKYAPGGAANAAVNISSLGSRATFLSVVGDDPEGQLLRRALQERGVNTDHMLTHPGRRTLAKNRILAGSQMMLRFDQGHTDPIDEATEQALIDRLRDLFPYCQALIVSDYGYGILTARLIETIAELQAQTPCLLAVDSKKLAAYRQVGVAAVKPNYQEVIQLLGINKLEGSAARADQIAAYEQQILELTGAQIAAVTLDTEGAIIFEHGSPPHRTYAEPRPHSQAAGAGDTFLSSLTLALAAGAHTPVAAELASVAAAIVVSKDGTTSCSVHELREQVSGTGKYITEMPRLLARLDLYRQQGQRIVFTNGCFDILHRGHITYLNQAKALGDILVVGLNSDESVRRLKGPKRPINSVEDRAQVLAALSCIDHIVPFGEDTPINLIWQVRPDVFVKGGDYTLATLPEAPIVEMLGGEVCILSYMQDFSTTSTIERIHEAYAWPTETPVALVENVEK